jgi:predicted SAM-dependent methyltransferase
MGYQSIWSTRKLVETRSQKGKYLASEYDNMFYNTSKINRIDKRIVFTRISVLKRRE